MGLLYGQKALGNGTGFRRQILMPVEGFPRGCPEAGVVPQPVPDIPVVGNGLGRVQPSANQLGDVKTEQLQFLL